MERLLKLLQTVQPQPDKLSHFFWGAHISLVVGGLFAYFVQPNWAGEVGAATSATIGFLKEAADKWSNKQAIARGEKPPHGVEWGDFLITAWGGLAVGAPTVILSAMAAAR